MLSDRTLARLFQILRTARDGLLSAVVNETSSLSHLYVETGDSSIPVLPTSFHLQPVFETINDQESSIVGFLSSIVHWDNFLALLLPPGIGGVVAILRNTCGQAFSYRLKGHSVSPKILL